MRCVSLLAKDVGNCSFTKTKIGCYRTIAHILQATYISWGEAQRDVCRRLSISEDRRAEVSQKRHLADELYDTVAECRYSHKVTDNTAVEDAIADAVETPTLMHTQDK